MYWISDYGGKWVIAEEIGKRIRAVEPDGSTPTFGPAVLNGWFTWYNKWHVESSVIVRQPGVHPGPRGLRQWSVGCRWTSAWKHNYVIYR